MLDILKPVLDDLPFFTLGSLAIVCALGVLLEKNIVRAGFLLVICFGAIAGNYFALKAPFVGASQILIYAVGITLVIVFALMLTSLKHDLPNIKGQGTKNIFSGAVAISLFATLSFALTGGKWFDTEIVTCPKNTEVIGLKMLGSYALPFELVSVLLLVSLIGAVVIAKKDKLGEGK